MGVCSSSKNKNNSAEKLDENYKKNRTDIKDENKKKNQYKNSNKIKKKKKKSSNNININNDNDNEFNSIEIKKTNPDSNDKKFDKKESIKNDDFIENKIDNELENQRINFDLEDKKSDNFENYNKNKTYNNIENNKFYNNIETNKPQNNEENNELYNNNENNELNNNNEENNKLNNNEESNKLNNNEESNKLTNNEESNQFCIFEENKNLHNNTENNKLYNNPKNNKIHNNIETNGNETPLDNKNSGKEKLYINVNYEIKNNLNQKEKIYTNEETPAGFNNNNNQLKNIPLNKKKNDENKRDFDFNDKYDTPSSYYEEKKLNNPQLNEIKKNKDEEENEDKEEYFYKKNSSIIEQDSIENEEEEKKDIDEIDFENKIKNEKYDTPENYNKNNNQLQNIVINNKNDENEEKLVFNGKYDTPQDIYQNKLNNLALNQIKNKQKDNQNFIDNKYKSQIIINDENCNKKNKKLINISQKIDFNEIKKMSMKLLDITPAIFWIDKEIKNKENPKNKKIIETFFQKPVNAFDNLNDAFLLIKKNKFTFIYILISGKLYQNYLDMLQKEINKIYCIPITIIFTSDYFKKTLLQKQKNTTDILISKNTFNSINDNFYNLGGVCDNLNDVIIFIRNFNNILENLIKNRQEIKNTEDIDYSNCFVFEYVDNIDKLILPSIYNELDELSNINDNEIDEFNKFFIENHYIKKYDNLMLPLLKFTHVPYEIISKFWIRSYTIESTFYKKLNNQLMLNSLDNYNPFIKMMYKGLQLKSFNLCSNCELYRIALVNNNEIELLKDYFKKKVNNLPSSIFFCKAFLSFSKIKSKTYEFLNKNKQKINENKIPVLFVVNNFEKNFNFSDPISSNADLTNLSYFPEKQEVLFFPFSSFTVEKLAEEKINNINIKVIYLDYLGKYKNQIEEVLIEEPNIKNIIHEMIINKESPFIKEFIKFDFVPEIEKKIDQKVENKIIEINKEKQNKLINDSENEIFEEIKIENFKVLNNYEKLKCCIIILLNDERICSSTFNSNIEIYNKSTFNTEIKIEAHKNNINHIFQSKNNNIISSSIDKTIAITKIFPDNSYKIQQILSNHSSYVFKCIELNNEKLVSCSDDFSLIFWEKTNNIYSNIYSFKNYNKIYDILETKNNEIALAQFYDKSLLFLDMNDKSSSKTISNIDLTGWNNSLLMLNDRTLIVGGHNFIYVIDTLKYELVNKHEIKGNIWSLCKLSEFSVLSGDNYGNLVQWKISSNKIKLYSKMDGIHDKIITSVINLGDNKIASCDGERIKILNDLNI